MSPPIVIAVFLILSSIAYYFGRKRSFDVLHSKEGIKSLHSRPTYYGMFAALWCGIPGLLIVGLWIIFEPIIITHLILSDLPE